MEITSSEMEGLPRAPVPRADLPLPFGETSHDGGEESERRVSDCLREHIRGVTNHDAPGGTGSKIDVVDTHRQLGDHDEIGRLGEEVGIDAIGEHAQETPGMADSVDQPLPGDRAVPTPDSDVITLESPQMLVGEVSADEDTIHAGEAKRGPGSDRYHLK